MSLAPTARQIALHADRIRFDSQYANIEAVRDGIENRPARTSEERLNLFLRDGLTDLLIVAERAISEIAKQEAAQEALEASRDLSPTFSGVVGGEVAA